MYDGFGEMKFPSHARFSGEPENKSPFPEGRDLGMG